MTPSISYPSKGIIRYQVGNKTDKSFRRLEIYPTSKKYFIIWGKDNQERGTYSDLSELLNRVFPKPIKEFSPFNDIKTDNIEEIIKILLDNGVKPAPMLVQSIINRVSKKYVCAKLIKEKIQKATE